MYTKVANKEYVEKPNQILYMIQGPPGTGKSEILKELLHNIDNFCLDHGITKRI
jgi:guanylate kinase